jgi:hypothetical protein
MPLRKLIPFVVVALTLAACSSDTITGPARTDTSAPKPHYESVDGIGTLGGGGRA